MLFYAFSLKYFLKKKISFGKGQNTKLRLSGDYKLRLFSILSYSASKMENVDHSLTPCSLSSYSLDSPETRN